MGNPKHSTAQATPDTAMISVVIPVYRAANNLANLHTRLCQVLDPLSNPYEIIFVEDCGGDASWDVMTGLAQKNQLVRSLKLATNVGQHAALLAGVRAARGDLIVTMDDDLQHPPEEIPKLLAALTDDIDVLYGAPQGGVHGLWRNLASKLSKLVLRGAMGAHMAQDAGAFRIFRTSLRDRFADFNSPIVNMDVLLTWTTDRFGSVKVKHAARASGRSGYSFRNLVAHGFNMVTGFSTFPLQMASLIGFIFSLLGVLLLGYVVIMYFTAGGGVPGFPFLASIIAIFSGVQLFALGIIGEYIARMHVRTLGKPTYIIREDTSSTPK